MNSKNDQTRIKIIWNLTWKYNFEGVSTEFLRMDVEKLTIKSRSLRWNSTLGNTLLWNSINWNERNLWSFHLMNWWWTDASHEYSDYQSSMNMNTNTKKRTHLWNMRKDCPWIRSCLTLDIWKEKWQLMYKRIAIWQVWIEWIDTKPLRTKYCFPKFWFGKTNSMLFYHDFMVIDRSTPSFPVLRIEKWRNWRKRFQQSHVFFMCSEL